MRKTNLFPCILLVLCMMLTCISCKPNQTALNNTPTASEVPTEEVTASSTPVITSEPTEAPTEEPEPTKMPTELTVEMFNEHDYNAICDFLDTEDENGVTNGAKISSWYSRWTPASLGQYSLYTIPAGNDKECVIGCSNFEWTVDGRLRNVRLEREDWQEPLVGYLDLSGCTALANVKISDMNIIGINVTDCYSPTVRISNCPKLNSIVSDDTLMELYVRHCPEIKMLRWLSPDGFSSDSSYRWIDEQEYAEKADITIRADGDGSVGFGFCDANVTHEEHNCPTFGYTIVATPKEGHKFLGWYDTDGNCISNNAELFIFIDSYETVDGKQVLMSPLLDIMGVNEFTLIAKFK